MADKRFLDYTGLNYFWGKIKALLDKKVEKVDGKGLSTQDYTTDEKIKLAGIEAGAKVNVIEGVQINGTTQSINSKIVNLDLSKYGATLEYDNKTHIIKLKGKTGDTLSTVDLPIESVVTNGAYDENTKNVVLTLQNGSEITFSVADLVKGLVNTSTLDNYVDKSSNQTIEGVKTFKEGIMLNNNHYGNDDAIEIDGGILSSPDLNTITTRGIYHCSQGTNTPSFDHDNSEYDLMVFNGRELDENDQGGNTVTQMVIVGFKCWIRRNNGSDWAAWERFGQATVIKSLTDTEIDSIINAAS